MTSATATSTGIPTSLPRVIQAPGGMPSAPANTTLIQVGFNHGLNYPFVVSQWKSATQIFEYLPYGIAYGLGIEASDVTMYSLQPYDTTADLHYITTLALAYVPSERVTQLQLLLRTPVSDIYDNPDASTKFLISMVNPSIPILYGSTTGSTGSSGTNDQSSSTTSSAGDGAPIGGDSGSSSPVNGTSVGIGVGAVAGAAVYAAAMVFVARRYRKKRAGHARTSSVPGMEPEMSQRYSGGGMGSFFMSGGRGPGRISPNPRGSRNSGGSSNGRSVREQGISAPVMAQNSLGWH